jgi:isocitrate dehydrogenase (NAD+)
MFTMYRVLNTMRLGTVAWVPLVTRAYSGANIARLASSSVARRFSHAEPGLDPARLRTVTLFPGDGIGPEIAAAVEEVMSAAKVPIHFEPFGVGTAKAVADGKLIPDDAVESVRKNKVALKG